MVEKVPPLCLITVLTRIFLGFFWSALKTAIMLFWWTCVHQVPFKKGFTFINMAKYVLVYCLLDQRYYPNYLLFHYLFLLLLLLLLFYQCVYS